MSASPAPEFFPRRTPVLTPVLVLLAFALFGWLAYRLYVPHAGRVAPVAGVLTPADRRALLAEHRAKETAAATSYGWVDQKAGIVRLPLDRAIELTVKEHGPK
ncbi:MAG: hypothetical protein HY302_03670 [Opitutae bacterium]|nr:hypothetical protein [Opitutae bacterium]